MIFPTHKPLQWGVIGVLHTFQTPAGLGLGDWLAVGMSKLDEVHFLTYKMQYQAEKSH